MCKQIDELGQNRTVKQILNWRLFAYFAFDVPLKKKLCIFFITDIMATVNLEVGQVILGDRVEDSLAENNLQGEINNHNEEIEDN